MRASGPEDVIPVGESGRQSGQRMRVGRQHGVSQPRRNRSLPLQPGDEGCGALGPEQLGFALDVGRIDRDAISMGTTRDEGGAASRVTGQQMRPMTRHGSSRLRPGHARASSTARSGRRPVRPCRSTSGWPRPAVCRRSIRTPSELRPAPRRLSKDLRIRPVARALFSGGRCGRARDADGAGSSGLPGKAAFQYRTAAQRRCNGRVPGAPQTSCSRQVSCTQSPLARRRTAWPPVMASPQRPQVSPAAWAACPAESGHPLGAWPVAAAAVLGEPAGKPRPPGQYWLRCTSRTRWPIPNVHLRLACPCPAPGVPSRAAARAGRPPEPSEPPQRPKPCEHLSQVNALATPSHPGNAWAPARTASPA